MAGCVMGRLTKRSFNNANKISSDSRFEQVMTLSDFISMEFTRTIILLLFSHRYSFKRVGQSLNAPVNIFLIFFVIVKSFDVDRSYALTFK